MGAGKEAAPSAPAAQSKPIKLRSACNQCFSAKVRCDGNKTCCSRCHEKQLPCKYSESRVGKVVGKRRKRPVDDSIGMVNSEAWVLNNHFQSPSMPSPATTNSSDEHAKRSCTAASWASLIADDQTPLTWDTQDDRLQSSDMADNRPFSLSGDFSLVAMGGLPTPALSPPQFRYLSPMAIETRPASRQSTVSVKPTQLLAPAIPASTRPTPESAQTEDEEMVCIKILAHLKKQSQDTQQTSQAGLSLLMKSNAAMRRILPSKTARSDYSCQLLLTNIMIHLVALGERTCQAYTEGQNGKPTQDDFGLDTSCGFLNGNFLPENSVFGDAEELKIVLQDVANISSIVSDSLKRKPIEGFQTLGRHESLLLTLGQRLKVCIGSLPS